MYKLGAINNTYESYQSIIQFYETYKNELFGEISLEISNFFAANMSAALGAVLDKFTANLNQINIDIKNKPVEIILQKNDFLTYYGKQSTTDTNRTTIKFQKLKPTDGKYFKSYVIKELIQEHNSDLPRMSIGVKEKIVEAIYEIFVNAQIHSDTKYIYTCGQFFPNKNQIEFTIVDTGIGFREKINRRFQSNLSATKAIKWAVEDMKTTKQGISGGIGLAILREFVKENKGKMQIISNEGFYQFDGQDEVLKEFTGEFPGTIVNLQFKTNDNNNYSLKGEININNIF